MSEVTGKDPRNKGMEVWESFLAMRYALKVMTGERDGGRYKGETERDTQRQKRDRDQKIDAERKRGGER